MEWLLVIIVVAIVAYFLVIRSQEGKQHTADDFADAIAGARQVNERLAGQIYHLSGSNDAAKQALVDAAERHQAAGAQIGQARTPVQARLAKQTALEGLYYIRAARTAMNMDPGPPIPELEGQAEAGRVSEQREVDFEGRQVAASPRPSSQTPNYFPGGRVAGRPVPAGWYSEPWWKPALIGGAWGIGSALLFSSLFTGMSGVGYDAHAFESGYGEGYQDAAGGIEYDQGGDTGTDWGGGDWGGGFEGGF